MGGLSAKKINSLFLGRAHCTVVLGCLCVLNKIFFLKKYFISKSREDSVQIASLFVPESHDREKGLRRETKTPNTTALSGAHPLVQWLLFSSSRRRQSFQGEVSSTTRCRALPREGGSVGSRVGRSGSYRCGGLRSSKGPTRY